jgi:hypothetical protein
MCGVVGLLAYNQLTEKSEERIRQESMIYLMTELLQRSQKRGEDATGLATLFADGRFAGLKMGVSAIDFVSRFGPDKLYYDGYLDLWRRKKTPAKISIGHCRKPSASGNAGAEDNQNNHPIKVDNIVGVHNGTLKNHENIFENLGGKRDGKVDSEAIIRLLHHATENGKHPFTSEMLLDVCAHLEGAYAVLAFNANNPFQLAAFRDGRPIELALLRPTKTLVIASEKKFLEQAIFGYNQMARLYGKKSFVRLKKGDVSMATTKNMSTLLFDLTLDVNEDTKIEDLFEERDIPYTGKKWQVKTTTTTYNRTTHTNTNTNTAATGGTKKGSTVGAAAVTGNKKTAPKKGGDSESGAMVWDDDKGGFDKEGEKKPDVILNCDSGRVTDLAGDVVDSDKVKKSTEEKSASSEGGQKISGSPLELVSTATAIDDTINSAAEIEELPLKPKPAQTTPKRKASAAKKVDLTVYPDVEKKASEYAAVQERFSDEDEVAEELNVKSVNFLQNIPLFAFANRIAKHFLKKGFVAGYVSCLKEENGQQNQELTRNMMRRARSKAQSGQKKVRALKKMTMAVASIVDTSDENLEALRKADIPVEEFDSIFTERDTESVPVLAKIKSTISNTE